MLNAAVIVPIFRSFDGSLKVVLIRRSEGGVHGGQLAFPGGKQNASDESLYSTAIRETEEEIGIAPEGITILAELEAVETVSTGFRIYPFLARIVPPGKWVADPREVSEVMEVDLKQLSLPENLGKSIAECPDLMSSRHISYYKIGRDMLWGASYRIFSPLLPQLLNGLWEI